MSLGRLTAGFLTVTATAAALTAVASPAGATATDTTVYLQNIHSSKCGAIPAGTTVPKTRLVQWNCSPYQNDKKWVRHVVGTAAGERPIYTFKNVKTGQCMTSAGASGGPVWQYTCTNGTNQRWTYGENMQLRNNSSGECLAVAAAQLGDGVKLIHWPCNNRTEQEWDMGS